MDTSNQTTHHVYEEEHVHQVYNKIATHFSATRFKPWPVVDAFLRSLPPGSLGLDVGCGNGKYLTVNKDVFIIASDRSTELINFARQHQPHDAAVADLLSLPHPDATFDFVVCIAAIHHLSTLDRRREAIRAILSTLKPRSSAGKTSIDEEGTIGKDSDQSQTRISKDPAQGEALIFVWALEQKGSRRGWDVGHEQDVLVPWVLKNEHNKDKSNTTTRLKKQKSRKQDDEKDESGGDHMMEDSTSKAPPQEEQKSVETTFQRYYHLYREGELESDIEAVGGKVVKKGYDRDNWWAICARED